MPSQSMVSTRVLPIRAPPKCSWWPHSNNRSYAILNIELSRVGVEQPGPTALSLLDLSNPDLEWTDIARVMDMQALKVETVIELDEAFAEAMEQRGPCLIEVML